MSKKLTPFIVTRGNGKEMIDYYVSVFNDSEIISMVFYKDVPMATDGDLLNGYVRLFDQEFYFMDLSKEYHPNYDANTENFLVQTESEEEFYQYFDKLKVDGKVMMGPEPVMAYKLVTWVIDKYGITWQLVL